MPLVYERAFGGVDPKSDQPERDWEWRNPVGTGFAVSRDNGTGVALPNVEYPDEASGRGAIVRDLPGSGRLHATGSRGSGFAGTYDDAG